MPKRKKKKSKTKAKAKPRRSRPRVAKKRKTTVKKRTRAVAKKKKTAKSRRSRPTVAKSPSPLGKVVHYYDKIQVAIVELEKPLTLGDMVLFKRGVHELTQKITSMQIEHLAVPAAKKGDVIGVKVDQEVQKGTLVTPA